MYMQFSNIFLGGVHIPNINFKIRFAYKQKIRYKINNRLMLFKEHIQRLFTKIYRKRLKNAQPMVHIILSLLQRLEKFDNKCTESRIIAAWIRKESTVWEWEVMWETPNWWEQFINRRGKTFSKKEGWMKFNSGMDALETVSKKNSINTEVICLTMFSH